MKKDLENKIYILDIETFKNNGLVIARQIRTFDINSFIIVLSGYSKKYSSDALKGSILFFAYLSKEDDYLTKLFQVFTDIIKLLNFKQVIEFRDSNLITTISLNKILFITTDKVNRKTIVNCSKIKHSFNISLKEIYLKLDKRFVYSHRSYIINTQRIKFINFKTKEITFDNNFVLKDCISRDYKKNLKNIKKDKIKSASH